MSTRERSKVQHVHPDFRNAGTRSQPKRQIDKRVFLELRAAKERQRKSLCNFQTEQENQ